MSELITAAREAYAQLESDWIDAEKLKPIVDALLKVAEAAEQAMAEIKAQRGMWPGEVDTLDDALASLKKAVRGE